jgi:hypothetical protein
MKTKRTPRSDCNYVIYEVTSSEGANYIGLTRQGKRTPKKAVHIRWLKHQSRARRENKDWTLYRYLRKIGLKITWKHKVLEVVRGRTEAYALEREIIKAWAPHLNDQYSDAIDGTVYFRATDYVD